MNCHIVAEVPTSLSRCAPGGQGWGAGKSRTKWAFEWKRIEKKKKWIEMGNFPAKFDSQAFGIEPTRHLATNKTWWSFWVSGTRNGHQNWLTKLLDEHVASQGSLVMVRYGATHLTISPLAYDISNIWHVHIFFPEFHAILSYSIAWNGVMVHIYPTHHNGSETPCPQ